MTPAGLVQIGIALFGPRWQTDLAAAIGVSKRAVGRWVVGEFTISPETADAVLALARRRHDEIDRLIKEITQ
jgi:Helix-turn-helix